MSSLSAAKKSRSAPPLVLLVLLLLLIASVLTYIIPAGAFDVDPETGATIAGTFHYIEKTPVAPWTALGLIYDGMVSMASTISLILYFGGIFGVFLSLGAAEEVVNGHRHPHARQGRCAHHLRADLPHVHHRRLCRQQRPDRLLLPGRHRQPQDAAGPPGGHRHLLPTAPSSALPPVPCAPTSPRASPGVELYSGFAMRTFWWIACTFVVALYIALYARRIKKNPAKSLMGTTDWCAAAGDSEADGSAAVSASAVITMLLLFGGTFFVAFALNNLKWERGVCFAIMAILSIIAALIRGKNVEEIVKSFSAGCAGMAFICFVMAPRPPSA